MRAKVACPGIRFHDTNLPEPRELAPHRIGDLSSDTASPALPKNKKLRHIEVFGAAIRVKLPNGFTVSVVVVAFARHGPHAGRELLLTK
ncbi:MAG: hypothetical protein WCA92_09680 [Terriglobales bacterium]